MGFDENLIIDKVKEMDAEKASEVLLSIIVTANEPERRAKAIENLIHFQDSSHFQEIKSIYLNESHSEAKIKLIELLSECYQKEGTNFLKTQYKNEKDWNVRKRLIEAVGKIDKFDSLSFLTEALGDSNIEVKKSAIISLEGVVDALEALIEVLQFRNEELHEILINVIIKTGKKAEIHRTIKYLSSEKTKYKKDYTCYIREDWQ
ncbi:hypothetical protein ES705_27753 [subsurface metagenome]